MTPRVCGTCRYYEQSGVWRQGWCRNPKLYGPQESHPVQEGTLDCETAAAKSFWQPAAGFEDGPAERPAVRAIHLQAVDARLNQSAQTFGGESMSAGPGQAGSSEERTVSYQPEERYWTDYLRIALPVIGLLLLIGLLWYWASALIGDSGSQPPPTPELAVVITPVNESTPAPPTATAVVIAPTPGPPVVPTPTVAAPAVAATQAAAPTAAAVEGENPCASMPIYAVGDLVVTTDQVNLREGPTTDSASVMVLPVGTQLQITGEFSEAGQCDWWPVTVTQSGQAGFVIEQYLQPVAQ